MTSLFAATRIRAVDFYRRVPKDLTEASVAGGITSLLAIVILLVLIVTQTLNYLAIQRQTDIIVDTSEDAILNINFNVTLPHVSCEWASVDLVDVIGHKRINITDRTVHKYNLDGSYHAPAAKEDTHVHYGDSPTDHYGNTRHAVELTGDTFPKFVADYKVVIVNFHAPWCPHCQRLSPIYEHASEIVHSWKPPGFTGDTSLRMATVDCTTPLNGRLCRKHQIQAFPSVRVFREGTDIHKDATNDDHRELMEKHPFLVLPMLHESYEGPRTAAAMSDFAKQVWKETTGWGLQRALPAPGGGTDGDGDGKHDSKVATKGCMIEGTLAASRVPGKLIIAPHSSGHSFNPELINITHTIHHFSFGPKLPERMGRYLREGMGGAYARPSGVHQGGGYWRARPGHRGMDAGVVFASEVQHITHEHYIKVVPTMYQALGGFPLDTYGYTVNSYKYEAATNMRAGEVHWEAPMVKFSYDLMPMKVVVREHRKPVIEWLTGLSAIVGGVYTCMQIVTSLIGHVNDMYKKMSLGKLG